MGKSSAPATPDYAGQATATAAGNMALAQQTTEANRVNTYTPYGSLVYSQDANNPNKWTSNVNLSASGQQLLDQSNKTSAGLAGLQDSATARVGNAMGQPLPGAYDPTKATNNATDLINARLLPQQQRDQASMNTQLANQGITQGSEAYNNAQDQLGRTQNDARSQAALQGINLGQTQQQQTYGQEMANRNIPMNELNALRTGSQVTNPTFANAPQQGQTAGADLLGATNSMYGSQMQGVNAANANSASTASGIATIAAAMLSDRRLKKNIKLVGKLDSGLNVYQYQYKSGGPMQIGVMAQEVLLVNPEAVHTGADGFMSVNYGAL